MSVTNIPNVAYGLTQPTINVSSPPIVSPRNPTIEDKVTLGTIWINPLTNSIFILTSIVDNVAFWQTVSSGSGVVLTLDADSGTAIPSGGVIHLVGGSNINTSAFGSTLMVNLDNSIALPNSNASETTGVISFGGNPSIQNFGTNNFFLGANAGNFTLSTAMNNTATGVLALHDIAIGSNNTADGYQNLTTLTSGSANSSIGSQGLISLVSGSYNIAIGYQSGSNYTSGESSNITIGNGGSNGESNTIRIGNQGSGAQQQDTCYIAGIYGTPLTGSSVVITSSGQLGTGTAIGMVSTLTGNSGGAVGPTGPGNINIIGSGTVVVTGNPGTNTLTISDSAGGGIAVLDGDTGSATGSTVTLAGGSNINTSATASTLTVNLDNTVSISGSMTAGTGFTATTGNVTIDAGNLALPTSSGGTKGYITINGDIVFGGSFPSFFVGLGTGNITLTGSGNGFGGNALKDITTGNFNSAFGTDCLGDLTTASNCSAFGYEAGNSIVGGSDNSIFGYSAGFAISSGIENSIFGSSAGESNNGSYNIIIGYESASNYTSGESSNIVIGNSGVTSESNTIRIGTTGSGVGQQNLCYIAGIQSVNVGSVATVVSISGDQLGQTTITAGTGITITPGANSITISGNGTTNLTYTNVATSPYIVLSTDDYLSVDASGSAITVQLPNAAPLGKVYIIKDRTGSSVTNNITITTVGGSVNIDGATTFVMNTIYESIQVIGNGSTWEVF